MCRLLICGWRIIHEKGVSVVMNRLDEIEQHFANQRNDQQWLLDEVKNLRAMQRTMQDTVRKHYLTVAQCSQEAADDLATAVGMG